MTAKLYDNNPVNFRTFFSDITDVNLSIRYVPNEVPNEVVINKLKPYGQIKGDLIRLNDTIDGKKIVTERFTIRMTVEKNIPNFFQMGSNKRKVHYHGQKQC